jgi:hypothetical protein
MERGTGVEPATSSLGKRRSIENKGQRRPTRCILTTENTDKTAISKNGVNRSKRSKNSNAQNALLFPLLKSSSESLNPAARQPMRAIRIAQQPIIYEIVVA